MKHARLSGFVGLAAVLAAGASAAQTSEFQCALGGAERATECLRLAGESALRVQSEESIERATALFVRASATSRAEQAIEQRWANPALRTPALWSSVVSIARAHREHRAHSDVVRWCNRWVDDAKRHASADVLTALHTSLGHAWSALGQRDRAYDAWRIAVHVWSVEHAYKLDDDGSVLEEYPAARGLVAPERWTARAIIDAYRAPRDGVDEEAIEDCFRTHENNLRATYQCIRALRPPPPRPFAGLTERGFAPFRSPFEGIARPRRARGAVRTRSHLGEAAFERGNRASGEAWLGLLQITVDEIDSLTIPTFRGADRRSFDAWTQRTLTPHIRAILMLLFSRATPFAQRAIATGVADVELAATALLANAFRTLVRRIDEAPYPPDWYREGQPFQTLRDEW